MKKKHTQELQRREKMWKCGKKQQQNYMKTSFINVESKQ